MSEHPLVPVPVLRRRIRRAQKFNVAMGFLSWGAYWLAVKSGYPWLAATDFLLVLLQVHLWFRNRRTLRLLADVA